MFMEVEKAVGFCVEEHLVAVGCLFLRQERGYRIAYKGVVSAFEEHFVRLCVRAQVNVLVQIALEVFFRHAFRQVLLGQVNLFHLGLFEVIPVEPGLHAIGDFLALHGILGEFQDGLNNGPQIDQFPSAASHGGHQRQGNDLVHFLDAFRGFRPALDQGEEQHAGFLFPLETALGRNEEVIQILGFTLLKFFQGTEFVRGEGPVIDNFLAQAAVQDLVAAQNHLGYFVGKIAEDILAGVHFSLAPNTQIGQRRTQ